MDVLSDVHPYHTALGRVVFFFHCTILQVFTIVAQLMF